MLADNCSGGDLEYFVQLLGYVFYLGISITGRFLDSVRRVQENPTISHWLLSGNAEFFVKIRAYRVTGSWRGCSRNL